MPTKMNSCGSSLADETASRSNTLPLDDADDVSIGPNLVGRYGLCPLSAIIANPDAVRTHSKRQIKKIHRSMEVSGSLSPPIIDETFTLLAGHGRVAAAKDRGLTELPVIQVIGLSQAQKRAFLLADNRIGQDAGLDRAKLVGQLPELSILFDEAGFNLTDTGFEIAELDELVIDMEDEPSDEEDTLDAGLYDEPCPLVAGDLFRLGQHLLLIGDARDPAMLDVLMDGELADAAFLDPPFNVRVRDIGGRGRVRHREFAFASGEMDRPSYVAFLTLSFLAVADKCKPGSIVYSCNDSHHVRDMIEAAEVAFQAYLTLVVWAKTNAGQGGLYRSQHELIGVFRVGNEAHLDNVQKGRFGRNRSNVWQYAGVNTFRAGRLEDLSCHPTVKPTRMVADAIRDVTKRGDIVLDTFCGSGTTILAAEKTGRKARALEIDPTYAYVALRRWEMMTGCDARHVGSGMTLDDLCKSRNQTPAVAQEEAPPAERPRFRDRKRMRPTA